MGYLMGNVVRKNATVSTFMHYLFHCKIATIPSSKQITGTIKFDNWVLWFLSFYIFLIYKRIMNFLSFLQASKLIWNISDSPITPNFYYIILYNKRYMYYTYAIYNIFPTMFLISSHSRVWPILIYYLSQKLKRKISYL